MPRTVKMCDGWMPDIVITWVICIICHTVFDPWSQQGTLSFRFVRAFPGGVGAYKMGCNYAPTIDVAQSAQRKGCQQVGWGFNHK